MDGARSKEEIVRSLGIFELRGVARELGVASPTTKKREELIDSILGIVVRGDEPTKFRNKKGRPFKKLSSIEQIATSVTTSSNESESFKPTFEKIMCFAQTLPDFDKMMMGDKEVEGFAREINGGYSLFDYASLSRVYIQKDVVNSDKLTSGDKIRVIAHPLRDSKDMVADEIVSINEINADNYEPYSKNNGEAVITKNTIDVNGKQIAIGRRNAVLMKEDLFESDFLQQMIAKCNERNIHVFALALNTSFENTIMFKSIQNCTKFVSVGGSNARLNLDLLIDCTSYAFNCMERGENVLLFTPDIMHSLKSVEECFEKSDKEINENTDIILQKLMSFAKSFADGTNETTVFGYYNLDLRSDYFVDKILKLSKNCE